MAAPSRALIAVLVATVLFAALWMVALKPGSSSHNGGSQGAGTYQSAINKAHQAVATANAASAAHGGTVVSTPAHSAAPALHPATATRPAAKPAVRHTVAAPSQRLSTVERAIASHHVVALLFYNPAAADDQSVAQELTAIPTQGIGVVKLAIPLNELASYAALINQIPVTTSPTLVIIGRNQQATEIVGFADTFVIAQRIYDALAGG